MKVGDKVLYDCFPHGRDVTGVIVRLKDLEYTANEDALAILSTGKWVEYFEKSGMSPYIELADAQDVRVVG